MDPKIFLDQPIKVIAPRGYLACLDCGRYFHHQLIWCPSCGKKIMSWTDISIIDFIRRTSVSGAGVINTLWFYLCDKQGISFFSGHLNRENRSIYDYAKEIREQVIEQALENRQKRRSE